jgi:hypothetical protein
MGRTRSSLAPSPILRVALLLGLVGCAGCSGTIRSDGDADRSGPGPGGSDEPGAQEPGGDAMGGDGDGAGDTMVDPDGPGGDPPIDCSAEPIDPGPSPLRLLTRAQYVSTVRDLFSDAMLPESALHAALGPATDASAFGLLQPDVTQVELEGFQSAAELVASTVAQNGDALNAVAPCADGEDQAACARAAIERFGSRVYRAPITEGADIERHLALFDTGASTSYAHGVELLLRGMLQAPRFLYRVELGSDQLAGESAVRLSGHEIATRLSYMVWGTAPDEALIEAAENGALATQDGVDEQLTRLLEDPRGQPVVRRFLEGWAHISALGSVVKDGELYPQWQEDTLAEAFTAQARAFFDHVLAEQGGTLEALLTSRSVLVNDSLASFYDVDAAGSSFEPVERPAEQASGVLSLPALLALLAKPDESSPIYRGKFVREMLLCQQLPSPPANIPKPPEVEEGVSTRERLRQHEVDTACSGCHQLLDPIGLAFERFDGIGRYRTLDGGKAVDTSGALHETRDADGELDGIAELGERLAQSAEVEECMTRQWFRYAINRFEQGSDACSMERLYTKFQASGQDLRTLPAAVATSDAFLYRRPITDALEVAP